MSIHTEPVSQVETNLKPRFRNLLDSRCFVFLVRSRFGFRGTRMTDNSPYLITGHQVEGLLRRPESGGCVGQVAGCRSSQFVLHDYGMRDKDCCWRSLLLQNAIKIIKILYLLVTDVGGQVAVIPLFPESLEGLEGNGLMDI